MNLFGACCVSCQCKLAVAGHGICSRCDQKIRRFAYCGTCGSELMTDASHCGRCLRNEVEWDRMVIIGHYQEPLSQLIHRFKFQNQFFLDRTLARLLLLAIRDARRRHNLSLPDVILPVPLHRFRHWRRGYNQAALLASSLSDYLQIPYRSDLIKRIKHTPTQLGLTATARRRNLKNAFKINPKIQQGGFHSVALVDDVITTGSTLNEIATQLRKAGIEQIQVWGLARA